MYQLSSVNRLGFCLDIHTQERDDAANHSNQHGDGEALALPYPSVYKLILAYSRDFAVTALFHNVKNVYSKVHCNFGMY